MRLTVAALLAVLLVAPTAAERLFDIDGPVELHIWMTAKSGHAESLQETFEKLFYPAVSSMPGFRSALLMRKPKTDEFTVRLSFDTEEQRMQWVASDKHQRAWPALSAHSQKTDFDGFAVVHPK